ncbi:RNA 2'-phosphotransferase [Cognatilysobacter terrigena]|uniref:RNA 2'-phosphotransferase n=1 Tax=Cognatilysobacter terrigena TaxID=2488749 RepID=UPI00105E82F1|nr:RNA 2'-phosphotransferase [Lysobacter terrigena]
MRSSLVPQSRFISRVLRHAPASIGLSLDDAGWADIDTLLGAAAAHGVVLDRMTLDEIVATNDKQRFAIDATGTRIRANQGHSIDVDLGLVPVEPPQRLFHGTATRYLQAILRDGLHRGRRRHVHLSTDVDTARRVGARHGMPAVLGIQAHAMHTAGHMFYRADNGVWLVDHVPRRFIDYPINASQYVSADIDTPET